MSKSSKSPTGKIAGLLKPETIQLNLVANDKNAALREVANLLAATNCIADFNAFFDEILERERVRNTALGNDVAIPHARTEQCSEILVAIGRSPAGIDFGAEDGQPVKLIFMIGTPKQMVTEYLRVVGNLARIVRQDALRQKLLTAPDAATFIQIVDQAES